MGSRKKSFGEVLIDYVCDLRSVIRAFFGISVAIFVLLLVSLSVVRPGSATYVLVVVDLVSLAAIGGLLGALLYVCKPKQ